MPLSDHRGGTGLSRVRREWRGQMRTSRLIALGAPLVLVLALISVTPASADGADDPIFTLEALDSGQIATTDVAGVSNEVVVTDDDVAGAAVGDLTMAEPSDAGHRAMYAATPEWVDLSWDAVPGALAYQITRGDGIPVVDVNGTSWRDDSVAPGTSYGYQIVPVLPESLFESSNADAVTSTPSWGLTVNVPTVSAASTTASLKTSLKQVAAQKAAKRSAAAAVDPDSLPGDGGAEAQIVFKTFISAQYVAAPPAACTYTGSSYVYGGDNRSYSESSTAYRTRLQTTIQFYNAGHAASSAATGVTHVYKASGHALVAQAQAPTTNMHITTLNASSTETDLRFSWSATNPFCSIGAIEGAFTIEVTASGNWTIISGSHRDMPHYEIYIGDGSSWQTIYERSGSDPFCLVAGACETVDMGGRAGSY
jgi:Protein of unknown function (DUF3238)